jgi:hypothetical protein
MVQLVQVKIVVYPMISKAELEELYIRKNLSVQDISVRLGCSVHKITYWMDKHGIKRRSISDAVYLKHNPHGDPFKVKPIKTKMAAELLGLGLGLYWGEGTKSNKYSIRLGGSDPALLKTFMRFLTELFGVSKVDMKFGLQIFTDTDPDEALEYWTNELDVSPSQFGKIIVTISGSLGTYRKKSTYGVVTVYYHNKKLRDIIVNMLPR